jgi:hypothetical protein
LLPLEKGYITKLASRQAHAAPSGPSPPRRRHRRRDNAPFPSRSISNRGKTPRCGLHQNAFTPSKTHDLTQPNGRHGTAGTPDEPTVPRVSIARRFYWLAKAWIAGDAKGRARGWLAALLGLSIAVGATQVLISYAARDFVTALSQRDEAAFWRNLWRYLATFALAIPVGAFYKFTADRLSLAWRDWMTNHLLRRYFYNRVYYRLRSSLTIDNPTSASPRTFGSSRRTCSATC